MNKPNTAAPVIMAERRAVVWARLEAHRAALAERRARRWGRLSVALWAAAGASFAACIVIGARHPESPAIGYAAAAMFLCAIAADCAAERGAR